MDTRNQLLHWCHAWRHPNLQSSSGAMAEAFPRAMQSPCDDKCIHMNQGGELFNNPEVENSFAKCGCTICPTGADASLQNGPVECGHRTVANTIQSLLTGANMSVKFWPHAFCHALCTHNAIPNQQDPATSPIPLKISLTFKNLGVKSGSANQENEQQNSSPTLAKASSLGVCHDPPKTSFGVTPKHLVSRQPRMLALMKDSMTSQLLRSHETSSISITPTPTRPNQLTAATLTH